MTVQEQSTVQAIQPVVFDLYRDIHKGIRAELFAITTSAGRLDPADAEGRADLSRHARSVVDLLVSHAEHEDTHGQPVLEQHLPALAEQIASDHERLDRRIATIAEWADEAASVPSASPRFDVHRIYLELASFTSAYLAHQDLEERLVMPALERAIGVEAVVSIHGAIVGSLTPDEMATSMSLMLPAMNVDDRVDLLGGMRNNAPTEVFAGVWNLAGSVLTACDRAATAARLGIA
jgi:hypothetical protein